MNNDSSLQLSLSAHGGRMIETTNHSAANNTDGDSISEPASRIPEVSVNPFAVSQALPSSPLRQKPQQQNHSQAPLPKMPWPRSAISKTPPPVRLPYGRAQSVQGKPTIKPPSQILTERPKSMQATSCTRCLTPFSSTNEEYQCPNCEKFFDSKCSSKKTTIWWLEIFEPVRVDDACFASITGEIPQGKHLEKRRAGPAQAQARGGELGQDG